MANTTQFEEMIKAGINQLRKDLTSLEFEMLENSDISDAEQEKYANQMERHGIKILHEALDIRIRARYVKEAIAKRRETKG